jgi:hypothetical protein
VPIIVTYTHENERGLKEFKEINDFGHKIIPNNHELIEELNKMFNY